MALQPGAQLGPYEIVGPLGAGGMGEVYRARDTRLDREVAVKVLPQHLSASPEARQRFEREARSASSLNHPNICTVHDIGSHEGTDYLVMELLEGETLAERIERGPMPLDELLKVAIPLADALDRAHRSGLVHRDLKPQNVMLAPGGAKLMDFGLAKGMDASSPTGLTATPTMTSPLTAAGTIIGTFQYMAPEQLDGKEADARSDLFAFGAMLYEMATGRRAFRGETQASLIAAILKEEPTPIPEARPSMPEALDHVVTRCLAKDPDARWQTARDMGAELRWIAAGGGAVAPAAAGPEAAERKALPAWTWVAVGLAAVVLFAAGWLLHRPPPAPREVMRSSINLSQGTVLDTDNRSLALSPDGTLLAYAARDGGGTTGIWVRRLDSLDARHLAGTEGATYPFWSPDGRQLGFFADGRLRRIPAGGGTAQTVTEAPDGRGATWGANSTIVFAPAPFGPLMKVAAAGGDATPATAEDRPDWTHRNPHFLPDGQRLLFFMGPPIVGQGGSIQSLDLRTGETRKVADAESEGMFVEPGYLAFVREGNLVVQPMDRSTLELSGEAIPIVEGVQFNTFRWAGTFTFSPTGLLAYQQGAVQAESQLTWFDLEGRELDTVADPAIFWVNLKIAPDGRRAVTSIRRPDGRSDVWIYDLARGLATRFTFGDVPALGPLWSPDGGLVAFSDGGSHIWIKPSDGAGTARAITEADSSAIFPWDWSPDGSQLMVMRQTAELGTDLYLIPASGEGDASAVYSTPADETGGRFSPDGRWVAFLSDESGRPELYVGPFPETGGKWQVSTAGALQVEWLPTGDGLIYQTPDGRLMRAGLTVKGRSLEIGAPQPIFGDRLRSLSPEPAEMRRGVSAFGNLSSWTLAPDGERILAAVPLAATSMPSLTLVTNWDAALERP